MTDEERAVIEAALKWMETIGRHYTKTRGSCWEWNLAEAVRALRESRKPKPRYNVQGSEVMDRLLGGGIADCATTKIAERICRLLNESEP